ncbi:hypothetical protein ABZ622_34840 [Streptomyces sp. NPDC007164]|uniref:hypothetical protein n=1 Tax=Streptomyces sp. NPDC007164 TaxID=3156918 RepID=UPI0033EA823E
MRDHTTPRTDFTHVLAAVRDPTRLELVTEAVPAVLEEVARTASHLLTGLVDEDWGRRYGRQIRLGKNPTRPKTRILAAGDDACLPAQRARAASSDRSSSSATTSCPAGPSLRQGDGRHLPLRRVVHCGS